jgi:hypothetical protein
MILAHGSVRFNASPFTYIVTMWPIDVPRRRLVNRDVGVMSERVWSRREAELRRWVRLKASLFRRRG